MIKKDVILNNEGAAPCKRCRKGKAKRIVYPVIAEDHGLFYARCPVCSGEDKYDYLGLSRAKAIKVWNKFMLGKGTTEEGSDYE